MNSHKRSSHTPIHADAAFYFAIRLNANRNGAEQILEDLHDEPALCNRSNGTSLARFKQSVCVGVCVSAYVSVVKSEVGRRRLGYRYIARNRVRRASERI